MNERKLTPREERSRDKWRKRGNLAGIQAEEGLSREELAMKFKKEAEVKTQTQSPINSVVYQSEADPDEVAKESARWIGDYYRNLLKGFDLKKKK